MLRILRIIEKKTNKNLTDCSFADNAMFGVACHVSPSVVVGLHDYGTRVVVRRIAGLPARVRRLSTQTTPLVSEYWKRSELQI